MPFTIFMPKLSPTMTEGTIAKWHKKEGEFVKSNELLLEITTDKATIEYNALDPGFLKKILVSEKSTIPINAPIAIFTASQEESIDNYLKEMQQKEEILEVTPTEKTKEPIQQPTNTSFAQPSFAPEPPQATITFTHATIHSPASPLAKRLAREKGLDLSTVAGSGPGGRIVSDDLANAQPNQLVTFGRREEPQVPSGTYEEIPLTPMRKIIARRLQEAKSFIPHFYVKQTINAQPLVALRDQLKNLQLTPTFNDMIVRASALSLRQHPEVNRGFHSANQTLIQFKTIDISLAVSVEDGLVTPIIRYADFKNLGQISSESKALAEKARKGKLLEHEYKGGSFCISNLGMYGITEFTAVLNPPQSAILAIGAIEEQPVVKNGHVVSGKTLVLTLSADHRVIDGALAAKFLKTVQHLLENPASLLL